MKVLRVISSLDPKGGGPTEWALRADAEMIRRGHSVEAVTLDQPSAPFLADYPGVVHALGVHSGAYRYSPHLSPWLRSHHHAYDAVIVDGLWQYHSFGTWRALHGSATPYFVFPHGMLDPWFRHHYPVKHLKKWCYWPWTEYRVLRDAKSVCFTCEEERRLASRSFWLYRCTESIVGIGTASPPNDAAGTHRSHFIQRYPALAGKRLVLFLGRIHEKKGCDLLLQAFAAIAQVQTDIHLVMAGPSVPGLSEALKAQATSLGISHRVTWTGMLEGDLKWGAYRAAELFCLPSHQENFGIAVAEALACGVPVLISRRVNIWREISSDGAALVCDDTADGATVALQSWFAQSQDQRRQMGLNAKHCFDGRFSISAAVDQLVTKLSSAATSRTLES